MDRWFCGRGGVDGAGGGGGGGGGGVSVGDDVWGVGVDEAVVTSEGISHWTLWHYIRFRHLRLRPTVDVNSWLTRLTVYTDKTFMPEETKHWTESFSQNARTSIQLVRPNNQHQSSMFCEVS